MAEASCPPPSPPPSSSSPPSSLYAAGAGSSGHLDSSYDESEGERRLHKWGYADTRFEFDGPRSVRVTGSRYPLAGYSLPVLRPLRRGGSRRADHARRR